MTDIPEIVVALTPQMNQLVQAAVASGEYASSGEVVREALREWELRRTLRQNECAELRGLWAEGVASGPGHMGDMAAIKREARRRLDAASAPSG